MLLVPLTTDKEGNIIDTFIGKTDIEEVKDIMFLGVVISCDGKNGKKHNPQEKQVIRNKKNKS